MSPLRRLIEVARAILTREHAGGESRGNLRKYQKVMVQFTDKKWYPGMIMSFKQGTDGMFISWLSKGSKQQYLASAAQVKEIRPFAADDKILAYHKETDDWWPAKLTKVAGKEVEFTFTGYESEGNYTSTTGLIVPADTKKY